MFFLDLNDEQVRELDPETGLYPFMVSASGETSDLSAVYHLLKRNPSLVNSGFAHNSNRKRRKSQCQRERKRRLNTAPLADLDLGFLGTLSCILRNTRERIEVH